MKPPSGGPITGPISAGTVSTSSPAPARTSPRVRSRTRRPTGTIIAPPMPCRMRATDELRQRLREAAEDRAEGEHDDRGAEHGARAEAVGHPAAERDEDGEAQQIGGDREIEPQRVFAESRAMAGSAVAIIVESRFCMNIAQATISGMSDAGPLAMARQCSPLPQG